MPRGIQSPNGQQELLQFFSSYLYDMAKSIMQMKSIVYSLIKVDCSIPSYAPVTCDIHSVIAACNRTYDDVRRIQSLLRGYRAGKNLGESRTKTNCSRVQAKEKSINESRLKQKQATTLSTQLSTKAILMSFQQKYAQPVPAKPNLERLQFSIEEQQCQDRTESNHNNKQELTKHSKHHQFVAIQKQLRASKSQGLIIGQTQTTAIVSSAVSMKNRLSCSSLKSLQLIKRIRAELSQQKSI